MIGSPLPLDCLLLIGRAFFNYVTVVRYLGETFRWKLSLQKSLCRGGSAQTGFLRIRDCGVEQHPLF